MAASNVHRKSINRALHSVEQLKETTPSRVVRINHICLAVLIRLSSIDVSYEYCSRRVEKKREKTLA